MKQNAKAQYSEQSVSRELVSGQHQQSVHRQKTIDTTVPGVPRTMHGVIARVLVAR